MPYGHPIGDPIERPAAAAEVVQASIDIAAPADEVFRALVDPHELATWLGGEVLGTSLPMPRDGSGVPAAAIEGSPRRWDARVVAPDGTVGTVEGEYGYAAPPHCLETSWRASWNDFAPERVRFELVPIHVGGVAGTRVTVTHTRATMRMRAPSSALAGSIVFTEAWPSLLARLAAHVAMTGVLARRDEHDGAPGSFEALHRAVVALHGTR